MFNKNTIILLIIATNSLISTAKLLNKYKSNRQRFKREDEEEETDKPLQADNPDEEGEEHKEDKGKGSDADAEATRGKYDESKIKKAHKLTPKQIEMAKKFWKNALNDHKKGLKGEPIAELKNLKREGTPKDSQGEDGAEDGEKQAAPKNPGSSAKGKGKAKSKDKNKKGKNPYVLPVSTPKYKFMPSGGMVFMDGLMQNYVPLGDRNGGLPDG